jgi:rare lipoprotein A
MRRLRLRRGRIAAAALLPVVATLTATALADPTSGGKSAQIDASERSVPFGGRVALRGVFPGAAETPIEIRYRAKGSGAWHMAARTRTGPGGRYRVQVKPRRSAEWRAELARAPVTQSPPEEGATAGDPVAGAVDVDTGSEPVDVRSRTTARIGGRHALAGDWVKVKGRVTPAGTERRVVVRIRGERIGTRAGRDGRFAVAWKAPHTGSFGVEVHARSNQTATGSRDSAGRVMVYRPAAASWYGPGLYGNPLACGGTLSASTLGVANRTLPCGTKVHLRYGDNSVTVPVVDRGPFAGGREYDLTAATKQALGFPDVGTVLTTR